MDYSYYGWFWIVMGAIFAPVEVVAYTVSIAKIFVDRHRIKKTNTDRRQTRLKGTTTGKRPNIIIVYDEERARKFMRNGYRQGNHSNHVNVTPSLPNTNIDRVKEPEHKQNGGHDIQVAVEHNLVVHEELVELAHSSRDSDHSDNSSFKEVADGHLSISNEGKHLSNGDSFSIHNNSNAGNAIDPEIVLASDGNYLCPVTILPDVNINMQQKQRPTKPKRGKLRSNHNQKTLLNETNSSFSSSGENLGSIDGDRVSVTESSYKNKLESYNPNSNRRYSYASADDTVFVTQLSPNRCLSADNLLNPSAHVDKNSTNHESGFNNVSFVESVQDINVTF